MFWKVDRKENEELDKELKEAIKNNEQTIKNNDFDVNNEKDAEQIIGRTVYPTDGTVKDYSSKYTFTHKLLKYSFMQPLIDLFMKKYRHNMVKELPKTYEFEKLNMFNDAYERALVTWNTYYRSIDNGKLKSKEDIEKSMTDNASERLRFAKEAYMTINANDTAYLEFHNMLMYELAKEFHKLDSHHLLYIDKVINDVKYFVLVDKFTPETKVLAKHLVDGYVRAAELVKKDDGSIELNVWDKAMPNFVKNTDLPIVEEHK